METSVEKKIKILVKDYNTETQKKNYSEMLIEHNNFFTEILKQMSSYTKSNEKTITIHQKYTSDFRYRCITDEQGMQIYTKEKKKLIEFDENTKSTISEEIVENIDDEEYNKIDAPSVYKIRKEFKVGSSNILALDFYPIAGIIILEYEFEIDSHSEIIVPKLLKIPNFRLLYKEDSKRYSARNILNIKYNE